MLFTVFLWTLLAQQPRLQAAPAQAQATTPSAADEVQDATALAALQARVASNPGDHQARMSIALLHERMGYPGRAEAVYRSVLLEDPTNLDAMMGVGNTLLARDASAEAIEMFERADRLSPRNPAVLSALGRAHDQAGHSAMGLRYLALASALAPTPPNRSLLEGSRLVNLSRVELRGFGEDFDGDVPTSRSGDLTVNLRVSDRLRVFGRGQVQRKFSITDERGGGGFQWRWLPTTTFAAHALVGPSNRVMPEGDYSVSVDHQNHSANWMGEIRYFDFPGASVVMMSPGVEWSVSNRLSFGVRYALSITESNFLGDAELGHTVNLSSTYWLHPRVAFTLGYAHGVENFENFSIDRIGAFDANTGSAGVRIDLQTLTSLLAAYDNQWRSGGVEMRRLTLSITQRF